MVLQCSVGAGSSNVLDLVPLQAKNSILLDVSFQVLQKKPVNMHHLGCFIRLSALRVISKAQRKSLSLMYNPMSTIQAWLLHWSQQQC